MSSNYYTVLGLPQNATTRQIRERFLKLAREKHPDRIRGVEKSEAERDFQEITQAFNTLSDPDRRRRHDQELLRLEGSSPARPESNQASRVYIQRGIKAYKEKDYLGAADNFDRATREDLNNSQAWYYLALACSRQKRWLSRARAAAARACELESMNATYLKLAGRIFAESGMATRAAQYYRQALAWGEDDPEIRQAIETLERGGRKGAPGLFGGGG